MPDCNELLQSLACFGEINAFKRVGAPEEVSERQAQNRAAGKALDLSKNAVSSCRAPPPFISADYSPK
ncbi:hypothetical protein STEG23_006224, partial [Scotinomys teguina]